MSISIFDGHAEDLAAVFGPGIIPTTEFLRTIAPKVLGCKYVFESSEEFERKCHDGTYSPAQMQQVYWKEILFRAHIAAGVSLLRNARWMEGAAQEYAAPNFLAWTACLRGLIEAVGDSMYSLLRIIRPLAHNHRTIRFLLEGKTSTTNMITASPDIEDALIHFTHARKLRKQDKSKFPGSHEAKATVEYLSLFDTIHPDIKSLYAQLCQTTHPASVSVWYMFSVDEDREACKFGDQPDRRAISATLRLYKPACEGLIEPAFNPVFVVLRVLHKFELFPKIPELRKLNFSVMPIWQDIEAALR